jgi:hypothetical protein
MNGKFFKNIILTCILSLIVTIFPNYTVNASAENDGNFDLNSVDNQSAEIIRKLKESDDVIYYEDSSETITFYIKEPELIEPDNVLEHVEQSNFPIVRSSTATTGVTKIVWHSGFLNFDLYLSANAKTNISKMTTGGATTYLASFLPGGIVVSVAAGALASLLPSNTYSRGSVYVFRNGSYRYSYYQ